MEKESSIIITLSHLADLALGSPELGAVNFNVLHTLLQVMIRQMNLDKTQVEFRGSDYDRIKTVMKSAPSSPTLKLSEYILNIEDSEGNITKISSKDTKKPEKKHKEKPTSEAVQEAKTEQKQEESGEIEPAGSVILVEQAGDKDKQGKVIDRQVDKEKPKIEVSQEDIEKVNKKMSHLEKQVQDMQSIPSNEELINRTRSSSQTTPVNDMWQIMNITKRMDAAEDCVNKLTSMVEDLAKGTDTTGKTSDDASKPSTKPPSIFERLDSLENRISKLEQNKGVYSSTQSSDTTEPSSGTKQAGGAPINYDNMTTDQVLTTLRKELEQIRYEVDNIESQIKQVTSIAERIPCQDFLDGLQEVQDLKTKMETFTAMLKDKAELLGGEEEELEGGSPRGLVRQLEDKINMCEEQVEDMRNFFTALLKDVHTQISKLEKELGEMNEEVHSATLVGGEYSQDPVGMSDICNTIRVIQEDLQNLNQTAIREMDDRLEKEMHIKALLEQIEILKSIKADREDLEDALAEKADQNMVNRKVSYDQFDAACDDLSKGLDEALAKLTEQESLWQQVLDGVQREIENKLDKIELPQLKDFVNSKLKTIQQRLKEIASMRKESEAAGTKLKLLRNVNCISCNSDVVMKTERETPSIPAPDPMPASRNMRPYLTYELDMVRKQQRRYAMY
ncbi:glutamine-rich protein 2-like [Periplaneta americana]|uniref:glutamine-rich protein 2-like n=1 Tax=Periplaneta americana TaxID=6978 RepID=UPI0037E769B8